MEEGKSLELSSHRIIREHSLQFAEAIEIIKTISCHRIIDIHNNLLSFPVINIYNLYVFLL